jgi:hypothetical protein
LVAHAIVVADDSLLLHGQDLGQIAGERHEGAARLGGGDREAGVVRRQKRSARKRLAASMVVMPASRSSCGSRFCNVPNRRSMRPRASGL